MPNTFSHLHQIFKNTISTSITKSTFMLFVFGEFEGTDSIFFEMPPLLATENINDALHKSDNNEINYFPNQRTLLQFYSKDIISYVPAAKLIAFIIERPFKELLQFYKSNDYHKYAKELLSELHQCCIDWKLLSANAFMSIDSLNEEQILCELNILFNQLVLSLTDMPALHNNASCRICKHFVLPSATDNIISALKEHKVLILYSIPGMGKTEFCNYIAQHFQDYEFTDFTRITYSPRPLDMIDKIEFSIKSFSFIEKYRFLQIKSTSSLLIITNVPSDERKIKETFDTFTNLNICTLLVVNSGHLSSQYNSYLFPALSEDNLAEIFTKYTEYNLCDNRQLFHNLCESLDFHTLSLVLIAKIISAKKLDFSDFMCGINDSALSYTKLKGLKVKFKGNNISFFGHLISALNYDDYFSEKEWDLIKLFSLFNNTSIDYPLLIELIPDFSTGLKDKGINYGILLPGNGINEIRMHKIFCELIQRNCDFTNMLASPNEKYDSKTQKIRLRPLMDNIIKIMDTCCMSSYSSSQIQELAFAFFYTIQNHTIRDVSNKQQATLSQERITWIKYCHKCILFFQKYGNTVYAQFILDKLCTEYHGLPVNPLFIFEKRFYELTHSWQTSHLSVTNACSLFNDMSLYIDTLSSKESDNVIIDNISFLTDLTLDHLHLILEKIISDIKVRSIPLNKTTISCIKKILQTYYATLLLRCTQSITTADKESHIKFINYCLLWTYTPTQRFFKTITLLELATTPWEKLRFLSDIVYWYSDKYLRIKSIEYLNYANIYHNKMEQCFKSVRNLPSAEIYSYCIANIYYGICNAKSNRKLLIQILHKIPDLQRQMLQLYDSEFYNKLNNLVSEICNNLSNNDK